MILGRWRKPQVPVYLATLFAGLTTNLLGQKCATFDVPGSSATYPTSINDAGDVAGSGFIRWFNGDISMIDGVALGINSAGTTTGYSGGSGAFDAGAFVRDRHGNVTLIPGFSDKPHTFPAHSMAINNSGAIAGWFCSNEECEIYRGFLREPRGNVTTFGVPYGALPTGINAQGDITGYANFYMNQQSFILDPNGALVLFELPPPPFTNYGPHVFSLSINNRGDVAGYFLDPQSCEKYPPCSNPSTDPYGEATPHFPAFIRHRLGDIVTFDATGASTTKPFSINDQGDVAGDYTDAAGQVHQFIRTAQGSIDLFDIPNAAGAHIVAMNNRRDVTGSFTDANGTHGFLCRLQ
jgi:hypothetical protein